MPSPAAAAAKATGCVGRGAGADGAEPLRDRAGGVRPGTGALCSGRLAAELPEGRGLAMLLLSGCCFFCWLLLFIVLLFLLLLLYCF